VQLICQGRLAAFIGQLIADSCDLGRISITHCLIAPGRQIAAWDAPGEQVR